ncbi:PREDICTED: putative F-box/LRR-repeat protein 23-like [Fragaria vesca subsp. vesca]
MKWRQICKDPIMWHTIDMRNRGYECYDLVKMCCYAIDRSCGNLVDISIDHFGTNRLLKYITDSSSRIKRLRLALCKRISDEGLIEVAKKLPLLEDLEISLCRLSSKSLEVVGCSCPLLKSFKLNRLTDAEYDDVIAHTKKNEEAFAIARTMHGLHHLQLFGNELTNEGLKAILDGCPQLESLDLRYCYNLNLKGPLGKRCSEQIKKLWLPRDSFADYDFRFTVRGYGGSPRKFGISDLIGFPRMDKDYDENGYGIYCGFSSDDSDWYDDYYSKPPLEDLLGLDQEDMEFFGLWEGMHKGLF